MKQPLFRQGDVLFRAIAELPNGDKKKREDAAVAYGEVTGHSHRVAVEDRPAAQVLEIGEGLYLSISEKGGISIGGATIVHEEHAPITLPPGDYEITIQREYSPLGIRDVLD